MILHTEYNPWCCRILRKNFPHDKITEKDIREIEPDELAGYRECHFFAGIGGFGLGLRWSGWDRELWTGGFPCQDISLAGKGAGLNGVRSGLWWEWLRLIRACRPVRLLIENVPALQGRGADAVLGSLEELGYSCWPIVVGAVHAGSIQRRGRAWIIARLHSYAGELRPQGFRQAAEEPWSWKQLQRLVSAETRVSIPAGASGGVADGIPRRMDRLRGLGNAVVPQVVEMIARAWMKAERDCVA